MPRPNKQKKTKKKPKGSKQQRAALRATGGWGDGADAFGDDLEQAAEAPRWRVTQFQADKNRRVKERSFLRDQKNKFAAKMSKPLFPLPEPNKKSKRRKRLIPKDENLSEEDENGETRRKVLCIRKKRPNSDSEDEYNNISGDEESGERRISLFQKFVETSKRLVVEQEDGDGIELLANNDTSNDQNLENESKYELENDEVCAHEQESMQQLFREAYDTHFRTTLNDQHDLSSSPSKFTPIEGFDSKSILNTKAVEQGELSQNNELEVFGMRGSDPSPDAATLGLQQCFNLSTNSLTNIPDTSVMQTIVKGSLSHFGDVSFAAPGIISSSMLMDPLEVTPLSDQAHKQAFHHIAQVILTARSRVLEHDQKIKKREKEGKDGDEPRKLKEEETHNSAIKPPTSSSLFDDHDGENQTISEGYLDQGFTRPRVLILAPTRNVAYHAFKSLKQKLNSPSVHVHDEDRFNQEFGPTDDDEVLSSHQKKPLDWQQVFGGNMDDNFKLGLQVTPTRFAPNVKGKKEKGNDIRLFTDFYKSDIIIASPLGMVLTLNSTVEGDDDDNVVDDDDGSDSDDDDDENDENEGGHGRKKKKQKKSFLRKNKKKENASADFLSSIEVTLLLNTDTMAMQNFDHVLSVFDVLNRRPLIDRGSDYSRLRPWHLNDDPYSAAYYRQNIIFSECMMPNILGLLNRKTKSHSGKIRIRNVSINGAASKLTIAHRQVFQRVAYLAKTLKDTDEERFQFLVSTLLPTLKQNDQGRTLLFIPSYYDFVRIRNWLLENSYSFAAIHEYSRTSEVSRSRSRFFRGQLPLLLYTGRAQYFFRYKIRGTNHLVCYQLPEAGSSDDLSLYTELVEFLDEAKTNGETTSVTSLFSKFDQFALERALGAKSSRKMLTQGKSTYLFS